jgi:ActR/RegA family two-component response regulator
MTEASRTVIVIDEDPEVTVGFGKASSIRGIGASLYGSVAEFMKAGRSDGPTCMVFDVRLALSADCIAPRANCVRPSSSAARRIAARPCPSQSEICGARG